MLDPLPTGMVAHYSPESVAHLHRNPHFQPRTMKFTYSSIVTAFRPLAGTLIRQFEITRKAIGLLRTDSSVLFLTHS